MNESFNRRSRVTQVHTVSMLVVMGVGITVLLSGCGKDDPKVRINSTRTLKRDPPLATGNKLPEFYLAEDKRKGSFGVFTVGMTKHVDFEIQNKGVIPLIIKKYRDSCNCLDFKFIPEEIPPGESGILRAIYKPTAPRKAGVFNLFFRTNDPKNEEVKLQISGSVVPPFELLPKERWDFGEIDYRDPKQRTTFRGYVISKFLPSFELNSMECSSKKISVTKTPIDAEMKKKYHAKSGYAIDVKLEEHLSVGVLYEGVTISLSTGDYLVGKLIKVRGLRLGPFMFQAIGDADWSPEENGLDLGSFSSRTGKTAKIAVIVKDLKDIDLKLTNITTDPKFLKIKLVKVKNFHSKTRQKFELIFEVPPNSPPMTRLGKEAGIIEVETNHPFADRIRFLINFVSY